MKEILAHIVAIQILANDLHYESKGRSFYALHLLADKVKEGLDGDLDELREAFYLGELRSIPPRTDDTYNDAIKIADTIRLNRIDVSSKDTDNALAVRLKNAVTLLIHKIEDVKRTEMLMSGTVAILDGISQKMLVASGLLERTLTVG